MIWHLLTFVFMNFLLFWHSKEISLIGRSANLSPLEDFKKKTVFDLWWSKHLRRLNMKTLHNWIFRVKFIPWETFTFFWKTGIRAVRCGIQYYERFFSNPMYQGRIPTDLIESFMDSDRLNDDFFANYKSKIHNAACTIIYCSIKVCYYFQAQSISLLNLFSIAYGELKCWFFDWATYLVGHFS